MHPNILVLDTARYDYLRPTRGWKSMVASLDALVVVDSGEFRVLKCRMGPTGVYPRPFLRHWMNQHVHGDITTDSADNLLPSGRPRTPCLAALEPAPIHLKEAA